MSLKDYVRLGLNHHLLFADECATSQGHYDTLKTVINDDRLEILDLWIADDEPLRSKEIELVSNCGKGRQARVGTDFIQSGEKAIHYRCLQR